MNISILNVAGNENIAFKEGQLSLDSFSVNPFVGFGCAGYRSFCGAEPARIGPFDRVQVISGQNNCGKSALIDYFIKVVRVISWRGDIQREDNPLTRVDIPLNQNAQNEPLPATISFCVDIHSLEETLMSNVRSPGQQEFAESLLKLFNDAPYISSNGKAAWLDFSLGWGHLSFNYDASLRALFSQYQASSLTISNLTNASLACFDSTGDDNLNYSKIVCAAMPWGLLPQFLKVGAIRSIKDAELSNRLSPINSGIGLPAALLRLYNPEPKDFEESKNRWSKLQNFVREITNDPDATILVSHDSHEIAVKTADTDYLPLESLGTGLTELIILAAVVACNTDKIICIEEPEIHLHPALQARFIEYLLSDDANRFIVTTHSPTIINAPGVQVAHVSKTNGVSTCRQLNDMVLARDLLDDLGARASDLLQSNYVVWVEGPSDRIYVNYWIGKWAEENSIHLVEDIHYSIMLYGGKLLNALDASPEGSNEKLIALFRINTHFCVLMDSDRKSKYARLGKTKRRIIEECKNSNAMHWVTWGSTIENYVPANTLTTAIEAAHPGKSWEHILDERFVCPLNFKFEGTRSLTPNKIAIAKFACESGFTPLGDCTKRISSLCNSICESNGIKHKQK